MWTPLHWAASKGDLDIVNMLLDKGALECLPDELGIFPVDLSGFFRHDDVTNVLIEKSLERLEKLERLKSVQPAVTATLEDKPANIPRCWPCDSASGKKREPTPEE